MRRRRRQLPHARKQRVSGRRVGELRTRRRLPHGRCAGATVRLAPSPDLAGRSCLASACCGHAPPAGPRGQRGAAALRWRLSALSARSASQPTRPELRRGSEQARHLGANAAPAPASGLLAELLRPTPRRCECVTSRSAAGGTGPAASTCPAQTARCAALGPAECLLGRRRCCGAAIGRSGCPTAPRPRHGVLHRIRTRSLRVRVGSCQILPAPPCSGQCHPAKLPERRTAAPCGCGRSSARGSSDAVRAERTGGRQGGSETQPQTEAEPFRRPMHPRRQLPCQTTPAARSAAEVGCWRRGRGELGQAELQQRGRVLPRRASLP
jgi:hypothetical protein